ncbi:hypothetical protein RY27_29065 [Litorilinea aerophila]|nr:hypothetical protein RY27_29065 [Litorilinea aerophila]
MSQKSPETKEVEAEVSSTVALVIIFSRILVKPGILKQVSDFSKHLDYGGIFAYPLDHSSISLI